MTQKAKKNHSLFIASTKQHIGKTTLSLGLFAALQEFLSPLTYMKPVGQEQVRLEGSLVDKDVVLFKDYFDLASPCSAMSPILIPKGFTREFLDHKTKINPLLAKLKKAHQTLIKDSDFVLMEGTGHCGVGSILNLNNAKVASLLKAPIILVSSGGLGSAFDELALNKALCDLYKVPIIGVILNKVRKNKLEMIRHYMEKALKSWRIPLLGCIPEDSILSQPSCQDFEALFRTKLLSGKSHHLRHFTSLSLMTSPFGKDPLVPGSLMIIPSHREEIIEALIAKYWKEKTLHPTENFCLGLILTGDHSPRGSLIEALIEADIPMLHTPLHSEHVMQMIHTSTVKIQVGDTEKIKEAIAVVRTHIAFETILENLQKARR